MIYRKILGAAAAIMAGIFLLPSCGGAANVPDTEPVQTDAGPFCGYDFEFKGGAKLENDVLSSGGNNDGFCGGYFEMPDQFSGEFTVTVTPHKDLVGGIMFKYEDENNYYRLEFDCENRCTKVMLNDNGNVTELDTEGCIIEKDRPVSVKVAYNNKAFKIFIYDTEDAAEHQKYDLLCEKYRPKGVFLDCGNGGMSFSGFSVGEYSYSLTDTLDKYSNPLLDGADPYILYHDGVYYLYSTHKPNEGYVVFTSKNLRSWTDRGFCLKNGDVYGRPKGTLGYWAPEVYYFKNKFYMFYTVGEYLGVAVADSPLGPFKEALGRYLLEFRAIDANLFIDDDGQAYLYYVKREGGNKIHGCKINLDTFATSDDHLIIAPASGTWELKNGKVAEGPCMIKHDGTYYLSYSCNEYLTHNYSIGYATSSDPLKGFERFKHNPILETNETNGVYGPGHHSFFYTAGGQFMIVYHRHLDAETVSPRRVCLDRCRFVRFPGENCDRLIVTGPTSTAQALPK